MSLGNSSCTSKTNCCVAGCTNYYSNTCGKNVSFYCFPSEKRWPGRCAKWLDAINHRGKGGKLWKPKKHSRICSQHFLGGKKIDDSRNPSFLPSIFPPIPSNFRPIKKQQYQDQKYSPFHELKQNIELSPLRNRPTMKTNIEKSNYVSPSMAMPEQDTATPILSSAKKKNSKQVLTSYILFTKEVRKSILADNPGMSFGDVSRLLGTEWRNLPLHRKIDYRERAKRQNEEEQNQIWRKPPLLRKIGYKERAKLRNEEVQKAQEQLKLMSEGMPQSPAETSGCFDSSFLETKIVIKEEPIDNNEDPTPSRLDHDFILPCTDSYQSCSTPVIKEVFTVVKTEPIEESQQITSNCRTTKQTSEMADVAKQIGTNDRTAKPSSTKTAEKDNVLEMTENSYTNEDAATSKANSTKDSFDVYGEYIAAKLRNLDLKSCTCVQKAFACILSHAEMGKFK